MAFQVTFWNFAKDLNSTKIPDMSGTSFNCILKSGCSILAPEIILQLAPEATPLYNYAYIPAFERYYRVTNWAWADRLWVASLSVDVLASWKTSIGNAELYVLRSSNTFDRLLVDTMYPCKVGESVSVTSSTALWSVNNFANGGCYVVGVICTNAASDEMANGISYFIMDAPAFRNFTAAILSGNLSAYEDGSGGIASLGTSVAKLIMDPFSYVVSVKWFPFAIPDGYARPSHQVSAWKVGFWTFTLAAGNMYYLNTASLITISRTFTLPSHDEYATRGVWVNQYPYTEMRLELPRIGDIPLDANALAYYRYLTVDLTIDLTSGEGKYKLWVHQAPVIQDAKIMGDYACDIGVSIPIMHNQIALSEAVGEISTTAASVAEMTAGNITAAGSAIGSFSKLFEPHISSSGSYGSFLGLVDITGSAYMVLRVVHRGVADEDNEHNGRPLCKVVQLSTIPGYIKCLDATIEIPDAFQPELEQIRQHLENGFYYE